MVMEAVVEDVGDGNMICINHPYKNNTPGGICAFCLQEKLGKLVSSSFPIAVFPSYSSSSSPSFRSDFGGGGGGSTTATAVTVRAATSSVVTNDNDGDYHHRHHLQYYSRRSRIPFLLIQRKKKKKDATVEGGVGGGGGCSSSERANIIFKRSKSTATPRRGGGVHFLEGDENYSHYHRRGFWSFLYASSRHSTTATRQPQIGLGSAPSSSSAAGDGAVVSAGGGGGGTSHQQQQRMKDKKKEELVVVGVGENESPDIAYRKVSRSRSVGCGSRSFSGDFFERISTGFGDCTLRRVESHREGKPNHKAAAIRGGNGPPPDCIKERVKCGGIFGGFIITSSSSSSSSSSYWLSSSNEDNVGKAAAGHGHGQLSHGRSKSWGWAFASPIRAFSKPSSTSGKRVGSSKNTNTTANLAAIPSLLAVSS